jgi:hypothetical protein
LYFLVGKFLAIRDGEEVEKSRDVEEKRGVGLRRGAKCEEVEGRERGIDAVSVLARRNIVVLAAAR